jgi:hypothetical protein
MTIEPRDGLEAAWLWAFRRLTPRDQLAAIDAVCRSRDGQPLEDCMIGCSSIWARHWRRRANEPATYRRVAALIGGMR